MSPALHLQDYGDGIYALDAAYLREHMAAIHMVVHQGRVAFIDTGSNDSVPLALAALQQLGLSNDAVDYVILTHIHLDHAGGAGQMMQLFQNAKLVVHPRGVRHMAAPEKLIEGVTAVYGADYVQRVYGQIIPIDIARIQSAEDGFAVDLAGRSLTSIDTQGHAKHHNCIVDGLTGGIFTGDMFGLSYKELDVDGRPFILPTTSPSQFDAAAMHASITRLCAYQPPAMYLTHYGQITDVQRCGANLHRRLDAMIALAQTTIAQHGTAATAQTALQTALWQYVLQELRHHGCTQSDAELAAIWDLDVTLNAQGLLIGLAA